LSNGSEHAPGGTEEIRGWCVFCRSRCGSISRIEGGRLIEVRPDPDHPTGGALCPKGRAAPEIVYSDRRILHPMRRTRPKGDPDPGWVRIGWDEALDSIASHMNTARQTIGPEAVAFGVTTPSGTAIADSIEWIERFIRSFGSPNTIYGTELCNWHKDHAHVFTFGCGMPTPDYGNAELMLLWGHNPSNVWLSQASAMAEGRRRGARLLVIDPHRSRHAAEADLWLQVGPGTDAALALGLARLLIEQGQYDQDFVRRWTNAPLLVRDDTGEFLPAAQPGCFLAWDEAAGAATVYDPATALAPEDAARLALTGRFLVAGVACRPAFAHYVEACASYSIQHVEALTGVPAAQLHAAAALIGEAKRIAYYAWTGLGQHANATQTERAVATLYALTGAFDRPGGNVRHSSPPARALANEHSLTAEQATRALGLGRLPLGPPAGGWILGADFYEAVLTGAPYPVEMLLCFGANLLVSQPDRARGRRALARLKFHVHCDLFHTPTSDMADILLPVNTPWERPALKIGFEISARAAQRVQFRPAMIKPIGESRSDAWIVMQLAQRLGLGPKMFDGDISRGWAHALEPTGLDLATVQRTTGGVHAATVQRHAKYTEESAAGVAGFATQTRRVELYSALLHRHGYSPVPVHVAPGAPDPRFPYRLSCAKTGSFCHSQHRGIASLRRRVPQPEVQLAASVAAARDIRTGDRVRLSTAAGAITMWARIDPSLPPDHLVAPYGWWEACPDLGLPGFAPGGADDASYNSLVDGVARDPVSGAPAMRALTCDIERLPQARTWTGWRDFRVGSLDREAEDVMSVTLEPADGGRLIDHLPGQYLPIRLDLPDGSAVERRYTLSGASGVADRAVYRISVRAAGRASLHLVNALRVGDIVRSEAPQGRFVLPMQAHFPVVMIAGGIGITPFIGYLESLRLRELRPETMLLYGIRDGRSHAFGARLAELAAEMADFTLVTCRSRDPDHPAERVSASWVPQTWIDRRARFYLCGPDAMMRAISTQLIARGVFAFDIFTERFQAAAMGEVADPGPHRVHLRRSGRTLDWTASEGTLLDMAERSGLVLPAGCRTGQCESCAVPVLSGRVAHLSDVAVEDGQCLTCQAVPASALVLDA
jgi:anaerobic selenocysteine-containing dehydrogenase/ferredoxin-NADP reductase